VGGGRVCSSNEGSLPNKSGTISNRSKKTKGEVAGCIWQKKGKKGEYLKKERGDDDQRRRSEAPGLSSSTKNNMEFYRYSEDWLRLADKRPTKPLIRWTSEHRGNGTHQREEYLLK